MSLTSSNYEEDLKSARTRPSLLDELDRDESSDEDIVNRARAITSWLRQKRGEVDPDDYTFSTGDKSKNETGIYTHDSILPILSRSDIHIYFSILILDQINIHLTVNNIMLYLQSTRCCGLR